MCGIAITKWINLKSILSEQKDRWLDWLWLIINWKVKKVQFNTYKEYKTYLYKNRDIDNNLCIMHHRKATVGKVSIDNAHPFIWKKFILAQNWTAIFFNSDYNNIYKQEVDTQNLLYYLEERCETLEGVLAELDYLSNKYKYDDFWNLIIISKDKILFWSDWNRESFIKIKWNYIDMISNYEPWKKKWFKNKWYIIMNSKWEILTNWFYDINIFPFYKQYNHYNYINDNINTEHIPCNYWEAIVDDMYWDYMIEEKNIHYFLNHLKIKPVYWKIAMNDYLYTVWGCIEEDFEDWYWIWYINYFFKDVFNDFNF